MTFRDDHDAALARIAALEDEVERWKADVERRKADYELLRRDNERLEQANDELRARLPKPKPAKPPKPPKEPKPRGSRTFTLAKLGWIAGALGVVAVFVIPPAVDCRTNRRYDAEIAVYDARAARWQALIELETCLREAERAIREVAGVDAAVADPRTGSWPRTVNFGNLERRCVDELTALADLPAMRAWRAAALAVSGPAKLLAEYYDKRDWKDDGYRGAPAKWEALQQPLAAYRAAVDAAWRDAVPAARIEIRALQRELERQQGRTLGWWRIELGFSWADLANATVRRRPFGELEPLANTLRTDIARAPLELRRELRGLSDQLDQFRGDAYGFYRNELWAKTRDGGAGPLPERPERPEGCVGDG